MRTTWQREDPASHVHTPAPHYIPCFSPLPCPPLLAPPCCDPDPLCTGYNSVINSRQFGMKVQFPEEYRYPDVVYEVGSRHCTHAGVWLVRLRCCSLFQIHFPREQKGNAETRCRGGGSGCCVHAHAIVWGVARVRGGSAPLHDPGPAVLTLSLSENMYTYTPALVFLVIADAYHWR